MVELGFARWPHDDEETNGQSIIYHEGQEQHIINLDEMALFLDGSTKGGGRPSQVPSANGVHTEGQSSQKSSDKITCVFGMNFAYEALPPYLWFPTKAKDVKRYKLQSKLIPSFRQVKGLFGYPVERYFDTGFAVNRKGGMNKAAF